MITSNDRTVASVRGEPKLNSGAHLLNIMSLVKAGMNGANTSCLATKRYQLEDRKGTKLVIVGVYLPGTQYVKYYNTPQILGVSEPFHYDVQGASNNTTEDC